MSMSKLSVVASSGQAIKIGSSSSCNYVPTQIAYSNLVTDAVSATQFISSFLAVVQYFCVFNSQCLGRYRVITLMGDVNSTIESSGYVPKICHCSTQIEIDFITHFFFTRFNIFAASLSKFDVPCPFYSHCSSLSMKLCSF